LTEQHRQDDDTYLSVLSAIRNNTFGEKHLKHIESRKIKSGKLPKGAPKLYSHNANVDQVNDAMLQATPGTVKSFPMKTQGAPAIVAALVKSCLSPEALFLKVGASVMCTKNNPKVGFVNGTLGTVESFNIYNGNPTIRTHDGRHIEIEPMEWSVEENGKILARITQVPLRLAWAITVHKSQGMSLDEAVMDLSQVFEYGQGYVALSRVRRLSGLHLLGWNAQAFQVHPDILERDEEFREESDQAAQTFAVMGDKEVATMHAHFVSACGGSASAV
jgi:hypothetical protein